MDDRILETFGGRLFACRTQTGRSKLYFQKKYEIDRQIFSRYEQANSKPSRKDKIQIIFNALVSEGVRNLNLDWLLTGSGERPLLEDILKVEENTKEKDPINAIKDINFFEKRYNNAIKHLVSDNSLSPFLNLGDWVCGVAHSAESISFMKNQLAIIVEKSIPVKKIGIVDLLYDGNFKVNKSNNKRHEKILKTDVLYIAPILVIRKSKEYRNINNLEYKLRY
ncbi:hypothetical protein QEJ31_07050 [Pigmentibacter sp. JX0631]|uniref:hypothetical protein n=1 Tax=Pigmentibacter sp. JX0631 TaxID=2976982 RepID=UPI00246870BD|nr:hypothetical protein [Pigmentibacter sp. JX0631]WGL61350.1 hypothetical protein QEJ31_07050 [Pigmentibacter sp. JX0631]